MDRCLSTRRARAHNHHARARACARARFVIQRRCLSPPLRRAAAPCCPRGAWSQHGRCDSEPAAHAAPARVRCVLVPRGPPRPARSTNPRPHAVGQGGGWRMGPVAPGWSPGLTRGAFFTFSQTWRGAVNRARARAPPPGRATRRRRPPAVAHDLWGRAAGRRRAPAPGRGRGRAALGVLCMGGRRRRRPRARHGRRPGPAADRPAGAHCGMGWGFRPRSVLALGAVGCGAVGCRVAGRHTPRGLQFTRAPSFVEPLGKPVRGPRCRPSAVHPDRLPHSAQSPSPPRAPLAPPGPPTRG